LVACRRRAGAARAAPPAPAGGRGSLVSGPIPMLVCSCNRLSDRELARAAERVAAEPGRCVVTPGACFRECGARPRCGGCFPLVVEVIHKAVGEPEPASRADARAGGAARPAAARLAAPEISCACAAADHAAADHAAAGHAAAGHAAADHSPAGHSAAAGTAGRPSPQPRPPEGPAAQPAPTPRPGRFVVPIAAARMFERT
jgi:bacterioferritin-associated ferredoxin